MFYMIEEMPFISFGCLLDIIAKKRFRNPIKCLCKKAPLQIFDWVLNRLWAICQAYLECGQKSMVEHFCKNSKKFFAIDYSYKKLHQRYSTGF